MYNTRLAGTAFFCCWCVMLCGAPLDFACGQVSGTAPTQLVVATRRVPPFAMLNDGGQWEGISIDLLREIQADLQSQAEHEIDVEFREFGLQEMLTAVQQGEVDLAAAALTVNYDREKSVDFTHPFHSSGLGIAIAATGNQRWSGVLAAIMSPTFLQLLGGLLAVLSFSGIAVYFFERKRNPEDFGGGPLRGIASGLWWAAVTMTTVGYGDKVPRTPIGKAIGLIWMFSGLFIIASFTAAVTSALTVNQLRSRIVGPRDLSRGRVATVAESTSDNYLRARHIVARTYPDVETALTALSEGEVDAVVYDAPILRHEVHRHFPGEAFVLPARFERQDYAFALPPGSPLRERINQILLRRIASPEWQEVLLEYLGEETE